MEEIAELYIVKLTKSYCKEIKELFKYIFSNRKISMTNHIYVMKLIKK